MKQEQRVKYDPASFNGLIWPLAKRWAWSTISRGIDLEDLVQAGHKGVARAAQTFDPAKGVKFNTYAMWWVRAYIREEARAMGRLVRVPEKESLRALRVGSPYPIRAVSLNCPESENLAESSSAPPDECDDEETRDRIASAIGALPSRYRDVIRMRFFQDMTLADIGKEIGVGRERARQLESKALKMIQHELAKRGPIV